MHSEARYRRGSAEQITKACVGGESDAWWDYEEDDFTSERRTMSRR